MKELTAESLLAAMQAVEARREKRQATCRHRRGVRLRPGYALVECLRCGALLTLTLPPKGER